jgi:hypothetical protein
VNLPASVHDRLLSQARSSGRPFAELLQYFAMERFLYRLSRSPHARRFVLKGALMLVAWEAPVSRSTRDIDLLGMIDNSVDAVTSVVRDICEMPVEPDGLTFHAESAKGRAITEDADYSGVRVTFEGTLGRARVPMQIDMGFGDVVIPEVTFLDYPVMLDFPAPHLGGYSRESSIAEKFQTMVKLGALNSRMNDFYDVWFLSRQFHFTGPVLAQAISTTFAVRRTPMALAASLFFPTFASDPVKATQWKAFLARNSLAGAPESFRQTMAAVTAFLEPPALALAAGEGFAYDWNAPGPWELPHLR